MRAIVFAILIGFLPTVAYGQEWSGQASVGVSSEFINLVGAVKSTDPVFISNIHSNAASGLYFDVLNVSGGYDETDLTAGFSRLGFFGLTYSAQAAYFYLPDEREDMLNARADVSQTIGPLFARIGLWQQWGLADRLMTIGEVGLRESVNSWLSINGSFGFTRQLTGLHSGVTATRWTLATPMTFGRFTLTPSYRLASREDIYALTLGRKF